MSNAAIRLRLWWCIALLFICLAVWCMPFILLEDKQPYLKVTFMAVGQGDAILIETPEGVEVLIDGGRDDGAVIRELLSLRGWFPRPLEVVVATHFDSDHIGGLDEVLDRYKIEQIVISGNTTLSEDAKRFERAIKDEAVVPHIGRAGDVLMLGAFATLELFSPTYDVAHIESNSASIVALLRYGDTAFLFTGDAPKEIETYLVAKYGNRLAADVLKLGHHGSRTSSDPLFLATVDPLYAVVSAGKDNSYGHPHEEVIEAVEDVGSVLVETAREGSVTFLSDGQRVWRE